MPKPQGNFSIRRTGSLRPCTSAQRPQILEQPIGITAGNEFFDLGVRALPRRQRLAEQFAPLRGEFQEAAAPVRRISDHFDQPAPLQRFQRCGQSRPVHSQQGSHRSHGRWLGTVERHEEGKLAIGQSEGAQGVIEQPAEDARRPLHMETKAGIPYKEGGFVREQFRT